MAVTATKVVCDGDDDGDGSNSGRDNDGAAMTTAISMVGKWPAVDSVKV